MESCPVWSASSSDIQVSRNTSKSKLLLVKNFIRIVPVILRDTFCHEPGDGLAGRAGK